MRATRRVRRGLYIGQGRPNGFLRALSAAFATSFCGHSLANQQFWPAGSLLGWENRPLRRYLGAAEGALGAAQPFRKRAFTRLVTLIDHPKRARFFAPQNACIKLSKNRRSKKKGMVQRETIPLRKILHAGKAHDSSPQIQAKARRQATSRRRPQRRRHRSRQRRQPPPRLSSWLPWPRGQQPRGPPARASTSPWAAQARRCPFPP